MTTIRRASIETKTAMLTSAGYNHKKWTRHTYAYSQPLTISPRKGDPVHGLAHYFRCSETGETRVWGFDRTRDEKESDNVGTN